MPPLADMLPGSFALDKRESCLDTNARGSRDGRLAACDRRGYPSRHNARPARADAFPNP